MGTRCAKFNGMITLNLNSKRVGKCQGEGVETRDHDGWAITAQHRNGAAQTWRWPWCHL